jgi:hypothetical protein
MVLAWGTSQLISPTFRNLTESYGHLR